MRYLSLESLSHLAISDLTREAIKKHQSVVLETLMVCTHTHHHHHPSPHTHHTTLHTHTHTLHTHTHPTHTHTHSVLTLFSHTHRLRRTSVYVSVPLTSSTPCVISPMLWILWDNSCLIWRRQITPSGKPWYSSTCVYCTPCSGLFSYGGYFRIFRIIKLFYCNWFNVTILSCMNNLIGQFIRTFAPTNFT